MGLRGGSVPLSADVRDLDGPDRLIRDSEFDSHLYRTALTQLDRVAEWLHLDPDLHERLRYPRRALVVSVPARMDDGTTRVFFGYPTRLQEIMTRAFGRVWAVANKEGTDLRTAALLEGVGRVAEAYQARGLYP